MKENNFEIAFANRIKTLRKESNISQAQLAEMIDMSIDTMSNIERAKTIPRLDTVMQIAEKLNVEVYQLFQMHDIPTNDKEKLKTINEIVRLLSTQPDDILKFSLKQTKELIKLKESFAEKINK